MAFYKAGKELADLHLNYEQGINVQTTGQDGDYQFFAAMPMDAYLFARSKYMVTSTFGKANGRMKPINTLPWIR